MQASWKAGNGFIILRLMICAELLVLEINCAIHRTGPTVRCFRRTAPLCEGAA